MYWITGEVRVIYTVPPRIAKLEGDPLEKSKEAIIVPVEQLEEKPAIKGFVKKIDELHGGIVSKAGELKTFKAGRGEIYVIPSERQVIYLVGLGSKREEESYRRALAKAAKSVVDKHESVTIILEDLDENLSNESLLGFLLGVYRLEHFKSEKKSKLRTVYYTGKINEEYVKAIAEAVYLARDVANAPPNDLYPQRLAEKVRELFSSLPNVEVEIFDYERLEKEGFGGIVNVGKGSHYKPRLIKIHYKGGGKKIAIVGKTIVFDAGGIQVKPQYSITEMFADKAGGAAVLGILWAAAKLSIPVELYGLLASAINTLDGQSYLPSDVIRMWDGTKVDIGHTDAEGRLVIADAIAYSAKEIGADIIIDLATLTGASVIALGQLVGALFTRDEELQRIFMEASKKTGEKLWPLPFIDEYKQLLTRNARLGDINNVGGRWGGAITAALFLEHFTHKKKFVHLDIAGPGIGGGEASSIAPEYWPGKHAPGYGVRLVLEAIKKLM